MLLYFFSHLIVKLIGSIHGNCPIQITRLAILALKDQCFHVFLESFDFRWSINGLVLPFAITTGFYEDQSNDEVLKNIEVIRSYLLLEQHCHHHRILLQHRPFVFVLLDPPSDPVHPQESPWCRTDGICIKSEVNNWSVYQKYYFF